MPTETIIRQSELSAFVTNTLLNIREGVAVARNKGLLAELPEEVQITATVINDEGWQALEVSGGQSMEIFEEQGGGSKETATGTETGETVRNSTEKRDEKSSGSKSETTTVSDDQTTTGKEDRTTAGTQTDTSTQIGVNNTAHNKSETSTTTEN
jgi:hypothetical protein